MDAGAVLFPNDWNVRYRTLAPAIKNVRTGAHGSLPAPKGPDDLLRI